MLKHSFFGNQFFGQSGLQSASAINRNAFFGEEAQNNAPIKQTSSKTNQNYLKINLDINTLLSVLEVKKRLNKRSVFMEEFKEHRKNELDNDIKMMVATDYKLLSEAIASISSFFIIEKRLNNELEGYKSMDELWEYYLGVLEKKTLDFCTKMPEEMILRLKKFMHYVAVSFRKKGLQNLCDDVLTSKKSKIEFLPI